MAKNSARRCATDFGRFVADSETVAGIARASRDNFSERYHLISVALRWARQTTRRKNPGRGATPLG
jgi:hypothetical protein